MIHARAHRALQGRRRNTPQLLS